MRKSLKRICSLPQSTSSNLLHTYTNILPLKEYVSIHLIELVNKYESHFQDAVPDAVNNILLNYAGGDDIVKLKTLRAIKKYDLENQALNKFREEKAAKKIDTWFSMNSEEDFKISRFLCNKSVDGFFYNPKTIVMIHISCKACNVKGTQSHYVNDCRLSEILRKNFLNELQNYLTPLQIKSVKENIHNFIRELLCGSHFNEK